MNIGKPKRTIEVEPVEAPVPTYEPVPVEEPFTPSPSEQPVEEPAPTLSVAAA